MGSLLRVLRPARFMRQRALYRGLFGGDRFWLGIGAVMWGWKFIRKTFTGGDPTARYIEDLKPGDRLVITHPEAPKGRRKKSA